MRKKNQIAPAGPSFDSVCGFPLKDLSSCQERHRNLQEQCRKREFPVSVRSQIPPEGN